MDYITKETNPRIKTSWLLVNKGWLLFIYGLSIYEIDA